MASLNKVILIGYIGRDPEISRTPNGTAVCKFTVATTESRKDANGNWQNETEWHNIVVWGQSAERVSQRRKGEQVIVEGKLKTSSWDKDGVKMYKTEIVAWSVVNNTPKQNNGGGGYQQNNQQQSYQQPSQQNYQQQQPQPVPSDGEPEQDELPF